MLKVNLRVNTEGFEQTLKKVEGVLNGPLLMDEAVSFLLNRIRTRFLSEVDPDGRPWPPSWAGLKRRGGGYTTRNGKKYTGTGTLFETGRLFRSIQAAGESPYIRVIGTDVPYAKYHQVPETARVLRQFLGFNDEDAALVERVLQKRLNELLA